jgi:thioredoxin reductase (NADPH)
VRYRKLPVPRLEEFEGSSIYYAATLVEARVCAGDPVAVVRGGNSGGQAALILSEQVASLTLLVRGDSLDADMSRYLSDRIRSNPRIDVRLHTEIREFEGDELLEGIVVEDLHTGERSRVDARYLFVFIGATPHTQWLRSATTGRGNHAGRGCACSAGDVLSASAPTGRAGRGLRLLGLRVR